MITMSQKSVGLATKEKRFMGVTGEPVFKEYYNHVAEGGDPDPTYWTLLKDGTANIRILNTLEKGYCEIKTGDSANDDCLKHTKDKFWWNLQNQKTLSLSLETYVRIIDLEGMIAFGFVETNYAESELQNWTDTNLNGSAIICIDNDDVQAHSGSGAACQNTDASAVIAENTWVNVRFKITQTSTLFYIDDALLATHLTEPSKLTQYALMFGTKNMNGIQSEVHTMFSEVWTE